MSKFEFVGTESARIIVACCERCKVTTKFLTPFLPFKHCGQLESIPEGVQQQFLDWRPLPADLLEAATRPWKARMIDLQGFDGEFQYERSTL
jgi:hypothetical protein